MVFNSGFKGLKEYTNGKLIQRKTSRKAQVSMGRWRQEWFQEDEAYEVDWNKSRTASNGRILLRRPTLYQSCSAMEEEVRNSSIGIATRYGLDDPGIQCRWGARSSASVQNEPATHAASYKMRIRSLSPEVKRPGRGVEHPSASRAGVKDGTAISVGPVVA